MKPHSTCHILLLNILIMFCLTTASAASATPVVITFSDGAAVSGEIQLIGSRPLTMVPDGERRQTKFRLEDIVSIEQITKSATMERPWVFKESGKADKVYLEGEYPLLNFKTRVTLVSGESLVGHIISVGLKFKSDQGKRKFFLKRQIKGSKEQKLEDIIYIRAMRMTENALEGGGPIRGSVTGFGKVVCVSALDNEREQVLFAKVSAASNFSFGSVLPGSYDLCVLTDTHVLSGLSDDGPSDRKGDPLRKNDLEGINKKFPLADDFFNDRWILKLSGNRRFAKTLVYKRRTDYYEAEKWTPGGFLWHLEVWSWHLAGTEWKVDRRNMLIRHKQKGDEKNRQLMVGALLDGVRPGQTLRIQAGGEKNEAWNFIRDLD